MGHCWTAAVYSRTSGRGCPVCSNRVTQRGVNDLATTHPLLAAEWADSTKAATEVNAGSRYTAEWACERQHTWKTSVQSRVRGGHGCPVCSNRVIVPGINDLATTHPGLAAEWDDDRDVTTVGAGSGYVATWKCAQGHTWRIRTVARKQGRACPVCTGQSVLPGFNDLASTHPALAAEWADETVRVETVSHGANYAALWRCSKNHEWRAPVYSRAAGNGCPACAARSYSSKFENEIADYVRSLTEHDVLQSARGVIGGRRELDIYVPTLQVAIEANGLFWHSEAAGKPHTYHSEKQSACEALGIRLIQVWEDDWRERRPVVERMLAHKLGATVGRRVFARQTRCHAVNVTEARTFLDEHHIQGFTSGSYYYGLSFGDALVAVMVLKRSGDDTMTLERYATSVQVVGGHSKLVSFARGTEWSSLVTFADLEVSDGRLYEATGWVKEAVIPPDYKYVVKGQRVHKFNYRLARFRSDPGLKFEDGLSERELAALNGLDRVWDSGKIRYRYTRPA